MMQSQGTCAQAAQAAALTLRAALPMEAAHQQLGRKASQTDTLSTHRQQRVVEMDSEHNRARDPGHEAQHHGHLGSSLQWAVPCTVGG